MAFTKTGKFWGRILRNPKLVREVIERQLGQARIKATVGGLKRETDLLDELIADPEQGKVLLRSLLKYDSDALKNIPSGDKLKRLTYIAKTAR